MDLSHCHSSNNDCDKNSNKDGRDRMGTAMIKTKVLMKMFTVKVEVDTTVATTMMAESNTQVGLSC